MFVHPKTGPAGAENIDDKFKAELYDKVYKSIKTQDLLKMELDQSGQKIQFTQVTTKQKK